MRMKKLLTFLTLLTLSIGVSWAADRWVQTDPSNLTTGDIVVIAEAGNKQAMTNDNGTSGPPGVASYELNSDLEISSTVTDNMQWVVTKNGDNYQFQPSGSSSYLYCTNTNNGVRVGTNDNNSFTVVNDDSDHPSYQQLFNTATSRYVGVYNSNNWRCYTSINSNIKEQNTVFYKKVSDGSTTTGPEYYLVGSFNVSNDAWVQGDANYKFSENNGTYTLNNVSLPANTEFKITKVDDGTTTWYGGTGNDVYGINHTNCGTLPMNGEKNYKILSEGVTSFSFTLDDNDNPTNLNVNRTASLSIKGDFTDNWTEVAMTATTDGWSTTQVIAANNQFGFVDEFGQYFAKEWTIKEEHLNGYEIPLEPTSNNYVMQDAGTYKLNVNSGLTTLTVSELTGTQYTLVESETDLVAGGEYIISGGASGYPYSVLMGSMNSGNYGNPVTSGFSYNADSKILTVEDDCEAMPLTLGGSTDAWTFYTGSAYLSLTSAANNLYTSSSASSDNAKWTIDVDNLPNHKQLIANNGYTNTRYLEYNSSSPRFACYTTGSQQAVALFKKVASAAVKAPVITPESGNIVGYSQLVTISQENNGTIYYTYTTDGTDPTDPTEASNEYTAPFWVEVSNLGGQVKIKAVAKETGKDLSNVTGITSYLFVAPANPVFTPAAGTYTEPQSVSLSTTTEGADIYYTTTAGLTPAEIVAQGTKFENPFTVSENTTYYAVTVYHDTYANKDAISSVRQAQYKFSEVESEDLPYSRPFTDSEGFGEFTTNNNSNVTVWTLDDSYGAKGTSYNSSYIPTNQAADSWLISPWINMTGAYNPTLTFNHSINKYFSNPSTQATVWIKKYGDTGWTQLSTSLDNVTSVSGWTYYNENIDLSAYVDQYIQVGFRYYKETSSSSGSGTWEIQNFLVASEEQPTPEFNPEGGAYLTSDYPNGLDVTLTCSDENAEIYYSTDGTNFSQYTGAINVTETTTIYAYSVINGHQSATVSASYRLAEYVVNDVVFSPARGTYKKDQTCQMFSTTTGARIYYTTDGSEPSSTNGTLYSGEIPMTAPGTYNFKAIAYIGSEASGISSASYTIEAASDTTFLLYSVDQLNNHTLDTQNNYQMVNPVQVVWMSTYQNNGYQPEYCLVRDNTGYGMIYFGKQNTNHNNFALFNMGDWISGGYSGPITNFYDPNKGLSDTHPELGSSTKTSEQIHNWSSSLYMSNSPVLPEYLTIPEILASENEGATDYWGHYVHLRKTTIQLIASSDPGTYTTGQDKDGKWSGSITDENGNVINYYDKFYLQFDKDWTTTSNDFTGHPRRTFDVYGFVSCYLFADIHYQISPFDFAWIDKPIIDKTTGTYYEPQTVTISSPDDPTATLWYKTSDMEDFAKYIPGTTVITVNSTTTIQTYATKQSQYNDELESLMEEVTLTFEEIPVPVISPESQVLPIADDSYVDATIAFEEGVTTNAVIYYTIDGSDPKTSENVYVAGETTLHFTTTTTVRAIAAIDGIYSAEAESKTYTFVKSNGIEYTLITDETELNANSVYVIVSKEYNMALANTQGDTNREGAGVMFKENTNQTVVYGNDDVAQFTLELVDASNNIWSLHTSNGDAGYLYVGAAEDNTLLTESEKDSHGNHEAQILIDETGTDHEATIMFSYEGATNRYLRFWNRDNLFNTYRTITNSPVYIYGVEATPLATIEKIGVKDAQYTIADELVAVWAYPDEGMLWCKDQGNVSIAKTEIIDGQVDYMQEVGQQHGDWDQSNWVVLKFPRPTGGENDPISILLKNAVGKFIEPATVQGKYINTENYTIEMAAAEEYTLALKEGADTTKNVYCTANFLPGNLNINDGTGAAGIFHGENANYFFMNPKIQEICSITFAEYAGNNVFIVPENDALIDGAFTVDWTYNAEGEQTPGTGKAYRFVAAIQRTSGSTYLKGGEPSDQIIVYPLDFKTTDSELPTAIESITAGNGEVKSVKYVNVAGMVSDTPFQGVNIVVTEYTDGTRTATKMLKR